MASSSSSKSNEEFDKINVIFNYPDNGNIPSYIKKYNGHILVKFTNFIMSQPKLRDMENLKSCPQITVEPGVVCDHEFITTKEQTRSGDEIFTVVEICTKCHELRHS